MVLRDGETLEEWMIRKDNCDFRVKDSDELGEFFGILAGKMRDALSPHASYWRDQDGLSYDFLRHIIAECRWLGRALDLLIPLADEHHIAVGPFRYFQRLIDGELPRDSDKCREFVDATANVHLKSLGREGYRIVVWDKDSDGVAEEESNNKADPRPRRMSAAEAGTRLDQIRTQGLPYTSQPALAKQIGCSPSTVHTAIHNSESLRSWANINAPPKAQSINSVILDGNAQERELGPEELFRIREYLERDDLTAQDRATFNSFPSEAAQIQYLDRLEELRDDPDADHGAIDPATGGKGRLNRRVLGRKP